MEVDGCLGGLQLLDLTQEDVKHQKVFSVGLDPDHHHPGCLPSVLELPPAHLNPDMYRTAHETFLMDVAGTDNALTFSYHKPSGKFGFVCFFSETSEIA